MSTQQIKMNYILQISNRYMATVAVHSHQKKPSASRVGPHTHERRHAISPIPPFLFELVQK